MIDLNIFIVFQSFITIVLVAFVIWTGFSNYKLRSGLLQIQFDTKSVRHHRETIEGLRQINASILTERDIDAEWTTIQKTIDSAINKNFGTPSQSLLQKHVVHFYHHPQDIYKPGLISGAKQLLMENYHILWVYCNRERPDFEFELGECLKKDAAVREEILPRCKFLKMTDEMRRVPINFSVVAPHTEHPTMIYLRLPADEAINFALRLDRPSRLTLIFQRFALHCVAAIEVGVNETRWGELRDGAKSKLNRWSVN